MKNCLLILAMALVLVQAAISQTANPSVSPTPPAASPTPPEPDEDVVKISTALIQVDVTVTDSKGNAITDLKPEEVEIYENGQKQNISNFSFISNVATQTETPKTKADKNPLTAVPPPTTLRAENVKRTVALVVDDLTLSFESVYYVRRALKKYVDEQMQDGDLVAIIRTGAGVGALQQFTNDKRQLYAAIEKVRWNPAGNGKIGAFAPIEATPLEQAKADGANISDDQLAAEKNSIQNADDFRSDLFATGTLGALNFIIKGMKDLPGRKSVMLMSDGFKLITQDENGFKDSSRVFDSLKILIDLANRSSVVVYTMDARGLQTLGLTAADDTAGVSAEQLEAKLTDRRNELLDTQDGLNFLAQETGGLAIRNNNDLSGGIKKMLNDQSYYLVGYEPDAETFNPQQRKFNKLVVKVTRPGARVRYRSGFFNVTDEKIERNSTAKLTPVQQINNALTSPFAVSDINLRLNTLFGNSPKQGAFMTSLLHIDAGNLKFTDEADGSKKAIFDIVARSFGDNGVVVDSVAKTYTLNITNKDTFKDFLSKGFVYYFTFPVKKPGAYQLRVAVRDEKSEKVGSANQFIEVPNLKKNRLTLSGVVLEDFTGEQWKKREAGGTPAVQAAKPDGGADVASTDPLRDTSLRTFKRGTILSYTYEIYNAKFSTPQNANLTMQIRVFCDGKLILDGKQTPIPTTGQTDSESIKTAGAINLGSEMTSGDYIMQIIVTDNSAKEKQKIAAQFVPFEIVE